MTRAVARLDDAAQRPQQQPERKPEQGVLAYPAHPPPKRQHPDNHQHAIPVAGVRRHHHDVAIKARGALIIDPPAGKCAEKEGIEHAHGGRW